jgi:hypothetical protein
MSTVSLCIAACGDDDASQQVDAGPYAGNTADAGNSVAGGGQGGRAASDAGHAGSGGVTAGGDAAAGGRGGAGGVNTGGNAAEGGGGASAGTGAGQAGHAGMDDFDAGNGDDAGPTPGPADGSYQCQGNGNGDSCSEPVLGAGAPWTLGVMGDRITLTAIGFDQAQFGCQGHWSAADFQCAAMWSRAGRVCGTTLFLSLKSDGTLMFQINAMLGTRYAICTRT